MNEPAVACCQISLRVGETEANRVACRSAIAGAADQGADIVVVPELANSGYVFADPVEARRCAEPLDGATVSEWISLARDLDLVIVGGLCELQPGADALHNSSVIIDPSGLRAVYRKAHLWDRELSMFQPGRDRPPVVDTAHGRIATVVCYDVEFPEWVRLPALDGAELLCVPTNWPREPRPAGERPAEVIRVQANASVNRMFIAACDRAGAERGVEWVSGTVIVGPDGFPLAGPVCENRAVTLLARCRLADARHKRTSARNDVMEDRRPELYAPVSS
ncbi:MAG TPA: nitrilase-related carbon-nitrogen hydrolase [Solirubrobacteraceae bacterium]|nr:nitrilase-related carbon-nitrogen hydrolase [Solirubrobacteraceae bacterium]